MLNEAEVKIETELETITMSSSAAEAVLKIFNERKLEGYSLRVYVSGGGCSGVNFGMALDNQPRANDLTFQTQGVQILIDDQSIVYLRGAKIDFVNDPERGAGFVVNSPSNTGGGCSCGSGGGHQHQHGDSEAGAGCACGGSCGCN